jgi:hypothetical protein
VIVAQPGRGSGGPVGRSPAEQDPLASQRRIGGEGVKTFALTATFDNATAGHLGKLVFLKLISAEMSVDIIFEGQISRAKYMCPTLQKEGGKENLPVLIQKK